MPSAIIFPTLNVGIMMMCLIFGMIIFNERPNKRQILAFCLGIVTIFASWNHAAHADNQD